MRSGRGSVAAVSMVAALVAQGPSRAHADVRFYPSPSAVIATLWKKRPRVVAFGEYHQIKGKSAVSSAVKHFGDEMLTEVAKHASDLIVETWVTSGKCGKTEETAVAKVEQTMQRPEATEDELVTLLRRAKAANVQPHILTVTCDEYADLQPKDGEIDYVKLLTVITTHLQAEIQKALASSDRARTVVVYGGALHNDLFPKKELAAFSFAHAVKKAVGGAYLEVDLYIPEYVEVDNEISHEKWFREWQRQAGKHVGQAALVERGAGSYIVMFPRAPAP